MDREELNRKWRKKDQGPHHDSGSPNFNDRADGYGFGPSESVDQEQPYEQHRSMYRHNDSRDENGMPNQYGPVDQYSFRKAPIGGRHSQFEEEGEKYLRPERYSNDDHSRYAGPNYREMGRDDRSDTNRFNYRESGTRQHPGMSGKRRGGESWTNPREMNEQRKFIGKGPKGYQRSDDRIYDEVCSTLMDSHEVDATDIGVKVESGIVHLEGTVSDRREKRLSETLIEDLPGVLDVRNELKLGRN